MSVILLTAPERFGLNLVNTHGGNASFSMMSSIGIQRHGLNILTDMVEPSRFGLNILGDSVSAGRAGLNWVNELDGSGRDRAGLNWINSLSEAELTVQLAADTASAEINGISMAGKYTAVTIQFSQDSLHNSVDITGAGESMFHYLRSNRTSRFKIDVNGIDMEFLIENVSGDERQWRAWGRSLSALEDAPYSAPVSFLATDYIQASGACESLLSECSLSWEAADDYLIPPGFSFTEPPAAGIQRIAEAFGLIVRGGYGPEIIVRERYPVRPVNMADATADVDYGGIDNIFTLSVERKYGEGYNAIRVAGASPVDDAFRLEVEDGSLEPGDDVYLRIYWPSEKLPESLSTYITQGIIEYLGEAYGSETEELAFVDGRASVSYPIQYIDTVTFYPASSRSISFTQWGQDVTISGVDYALADITYGTRYQRFRAHEHNISRLLAAFGSGKADTEVMVYIAGEDEFEAPSVQDSAICTDAGKKARGMAEIDKTRYDRDIVKIQAPWFAAAKDGNIAYLNDAGVRISGNAHINGVTIQIGLIEIVSDVELIAWRL